MNSRTGFNKSNVVSLYINANELYETASLTYANGESDVVESSGGRVVIVEASAGDKIEVRTNIMDGIYNKIMLCVEFIPKM